MANWRVARCLVTLRDEVNLRNPNRSKGSDGSIGDAAHRQRKSSHNPDKYGVVRALDFTAASWTNDLAELLRSLGAAGDRRVLYLIWNRGTCSARTNWQWVKYDGKNPHTTHLHISCSDDPGVYDRTNPWGWVQYPAPPLPTPQEKIAPMYRPALTIAAVLRVDPSDPLSPIAVAASPSGGIFCWATHYTGSMEEPELRQHFVGREVARLYWAKDGGYGIEATSKEIYEPRIARLMGK